MSRKGALCLLAVVAGLLAGMQPAASQPAVSGGPPAAGTVAPAACGATEGLSLAGRPLEELENPDAAACCAACQAAAARNCTVWVFCPAPAGCTHIDNRVVPRGTCALLLQQPTNLHLEATPEAPPEALLFTAWGTNVSFVSGYIGGQPNAGPGLADYPWGQVESAEPSLAYGQGTVIARWEIFVNLTLAGGAPQAVAEAGPRPASDGEPSGTLFLSMGIYSGPNATVNGRHASYVLELHNVEELTSAQIRQGSNTSDALGPLVALLAPSGSARALGSEAPPQFDPPVDASNVSFSGILAFKEFGGPARLTDAQLADLRFDDILFEELVNADQMWAVVSTRGAPAGLLRGKIDLGNEIYGRVQP